MGTYDACTRLLGLALRGGNLVTGSDAVQAAAYAGQIRLLMLSADASPHVCRDAQRWAERANCTLIALPCDKAELGGALGRGNVAVAALTDTGLAAAVAERLAEIDPERYTDTAERFKRKVERAGERKAAKARARPAKAAAKRNPGAVRNGKPGAVRTSVKREPDAVRDAPKRKPDAGRNGTPGTTRSAKPGAARTPGKRKPDAAHTSKRKPDAARNNTPGTARNSKPGAAHGRTPHRADNPRSRRKT